MKRILKKNQVVLTLLAVMIAVAGYLNYTADNKMQNVSVDSRQGRDAEEHQEFSGELLEISDEDILEENKALSAALQETFDDSVEDPGKEIPGTAVLTSGTTVLDYVAGVQLSREQTRAKNKESLMEIIDNANLDEAQKQIAIETMLQMTAIAEKETAAESLLAAKGFENSIVYINDKSVDVVICRTALTDAERAQIEDIVKRKAEVTADKIVLTLLEMENQE